ncbi:hypothetical protein SAMN04487926_12221 [Paraburkholderia steynii]|uniref:Uncharacterized protein n=1 Tax=Paraburkholderia steynii TaxID=1245441 RepID=A0A7Z7BC95_9BURK|nr:hypothetical protein [Paraburkholderia steynii]SDI69905.1 hypothetical protein SAMN04487926_12221 [Paraburkholderia steynii]
MSSHIATHSLHEGFDTWHAQTLVDHDVMLAEVIVKGSWIELTKQLRGQFDALPVSCARTTYCIRDTHSLAQRVKEAEQTARMPRAIGDS